MAKEAGHGLPAWKTEGITVRGLHFTPSDIEALAETVRIAWVEWARSRPNPKPHWLVPWTDLPEKDRDADRFIGVFLMRRMAEWFADAAVESAWAEVDSLRSQLTAANASIKAATERAERAERGGAQDWRGSSEHWESEAKHYRMLFGKMRPVVDAAREAEKLYDPMFGIDTPIGKDFAEWLEKRLRPALRALDSSAPVEASEQMMVRRVTK